MMDNLEWWRFFTRFAERRLLDIIYTYKISRKILQNERISNDNLYLLD